MSPSVMAPVTRPASSVAKSVIEPPGSLLSRASASSRVAVCGMRLSFIVYQIITVYRPDWFCAITTSAIVQSSIVSRSRLRSRGMGEGTRRGKAPRGICLIESGLMT